MELDQLNDDRMFINVREYINYRFDIYLGYVNYCKEKVICSKDICWCRSNLMSAG